MKQTFSFTKNALIWFLLTIILFLSPLFSLNFFYLSLSSLSPLWLTSLSLSLSSFNFLPSMSSCPEGVFHLPLLSLWSQEEWGWRWVRELLQLNYFPSWTLFSLSLSKDFETRFFPSFKGHQGCSCSNHNDCDFPASGLSVTFRTVFAMHFISSEGGEKQEMFSSRLVRGCHVLPSTIRPSSNWIRGITRIASHSKNQMRTERITIDDYL